ncbi:DedA family protein [Hirschia litorea]|uniref:DedA family protein n=1 Tax=Hirschia litorea TaxID=1199156 RepID=A0ABW2IH33_9PROT
MLESLLSFFEVYPWGIYVCFLILPFVQEDAAVIGAAAASAHGLGEPALLVISILAGLTASDLWKYWAGRAAISHQWAKKYAAKPSVKRARDGVVNHLASSLMVVRFVPGTRIPFYVAAGFFKAPFPKFSFYVMLSAFVYVAITFVLFHAFGEIAGERAKAILPIIAVTLVVVLIGVQYVRRKRANANMDPEEAEEKGASSN